MDHKAATIKRWYKNAERRPKTEKAFSDDYLKAILSEFIILYEESKGSNLELIKLFALAAKIVSDRMIKPILRGQ